MGGRGSSSSTGAGTAIGGGGGAGGLFFNNAQQNPNIANQPPTANNTPVVPNAVGTLSQMSDDQMATLINQSKNVDMPNHLSDVSDKTQKFVYAAGINEKPTVLDDASFNQYLQQNNIPRSQILARSVNGATYVVNGTRMKLSPTQVTSMIKDSELTYVGGKKGGMLHGAGTYFDMNGGRNTGYAGGATVIGVLSPNARVIKDGSQLDSAVRSFQRTHPKAASAIGSYNNSTKSIYALCMGYNVIEDYGYHNVIDRSALVLRQSDL